MLSCSRKFTLLELLAVAIAFAIFCFFLYTLKIHSKTGESIQKCKSNLKQLGVAMQLYIDLRGKGSRLPPFNGAEFWVHMYRTEVLIDSEIYLCPKTYDDNNGGKYLLRTTLPPTACSYGGRINALGDPRRIYTGRNASDTPIGCDDDEGSPNHQEVVNVLFFDNSAKEFVLTGPHPALELGGKRIGAGILSVCTN